MQRSKFLKAKLLRYIGVSLFAFLAFGIVLTTMQSKQVDATSNNNVINFQARLLTSSGALVPDGTYNIQFRLYNSINPSSDGGSWIPSHSTTTNTSDCGASGTDTNCEWAENYLVGTNPVTVLNGYISVSLGSVTSFPSTINWEQPQYLSMNIGGTSAIGSGGTWDGEMGSGGTTGTVNTYTDNGNRIQMTAQPYAFDSTQLTNNNGGRQVLSWGSDTGTDAITLPDTSGTLLVGSAGTGSNTGVELSPSSAQTGTFNVSGAGTVSGILTTGSDALDTSTAGVLSVGNTYATGITLGANTTVNSNKSFTADGSSTFQDASTSSTALQVENVAGGSLLSVDNSGEQTILGNNGATSAQAGKLVFDNGVNGGSAATISLASSTSNTNSYSLVLPTQAPTAGSCLETSTSSITQLIFSSCSNENASISYLASANTSGSALSSMTISTPVIGDLEVVTLKVANSGVFATAGTGVSGGGVTTWSRIIKGTTQTNNTEMWMGTVKSTGSTTISFTYTGGSAGTVEATETEFTAPGVSSNSSWGLDVGNYASNGSSTSAAFPSLNTESTGEVYVGYGYMSAGTTSGGAAPGTSGPTTGFTYIKTALNDSLIYNTNLTSVSNPYAPTSVENTGTSNTEGAIITAFVSSTAINNSTSQQQGNFNVQAATSGSVAGVLEANSSGTGDILDLYNGSSALVDNVTSAGNVAINPSAISNNAFQVEYSGLGNLINVDTTTTNGTITLGNDSEGTVIIGSSSNGVTYNGTTHLASLAGNARQTRTITLGAEYTNAVLDNTFVSPSDLGTMTSGVDTTNTDYSGSPSLFTPMNYYNWTSATGTAESYDVVVQVPIPTDFNAWATSNPITINDEVSATSGSVVDVQLTDSSGDVSNGSSSGTGGTLGTPTYAITPASPNLWTSNSLNTNVLTGTTYTPGGFMTIRLRVTSTTANVRIGAITLSYLTSF